MASAAEVVRNNAVREAIAALTAPGQPYEMRTETIGGRSQRVWVHSPADLRQVLDSSVKYGDRTFLVLGQERWSFERHRRAAVALAHHLVDDLAIGPGDRVAIAMRNRPEWSVAFWAIVSIGAIAVPLNGWWLGHELAFALSDSGARVLIADEERAERVRAELPDTVEHVIVTGARFDDVIAGRKGADRLPHVEIDPDQDATLLYTSGTTGRAKGVVGSHRNMVSSLLSRRFFRDVHESMTLSDAATTGDVQPSLPPVTLLTVPLFHVTGSHSYLLTALASGTTLVLMHRWDVHEALDLVAREQITSLGGVPFMALQIAEVYDPDRHDLRSLTALSVGGAASPPGLAPQLTRLLPGVVLGNGYGMTETSAVA
ncbi:MAG: long-chain fatty acid--CoA ligase, partial [Acidimicrobiia bacterium]